MGRRKFPCPKIHGCQKCRMTRHELPIIVKVTRLENDVDPCGKPCRVTAHGIDRFPDASNEVPPNPKIYQTDCETCKKIIHEKDRQIFDKEHEMMKLMLNLITLPKTDEEEATGSNVEHNYKGLRDIERELLKKDQELAQMKFEACGEACYNTLRERQLELRWKELEEERRPHIIPDWLKKMKNKVHGIKKEHCFKALQKKELELKEKEAEIDEQIEKFKEKEFETELAELKAELEFRRRPIVVEANVDCSCDCARINQIQDKEKRRQEKLARNACLYMPIAAYIPFWTCDTMELINDVRYCIPKMAKVPPCPKRKGDMMNRRICTKDPRSYK